MYHKSMRESTAFSLGEDVLERNEDASKTSSISLRYVIEVTVPVTPVMVQPCSFSRPSTLAMRRLVVCCQKAMEQHTFECADLARCPTSALLSDFLSLTDLVKPDLLLLVTRFYLRVLTL